MKIINLILDARLGGPQWRIAEVSKQLKEREIDTIVIFPKKDSEKFQKLLKKYGIEYKVLNLDKLSKNPILLLKWFITFIPQTLTLKKVIKEINPDIVHCNASWQWKGVIAAKLAKKKVIWHLNDTKMPFYIRLIFKYLIKRVDAIIVAGRRVKEYYLKNFKIEMPVVEIQAPVDTEKFNPEKTDTDDKLSKYKGIKILSVGNVNPYKGIEYLIEAANILNKKYDNLWFFIAGGLFESQKAYINMLKKRIKDYNLKNFVFLGSVDNIAEVLKASDIYVCSSIAEASPQSVWEAMAMEKPIVSTDVGSVSDFIKEGENGFIVPIEKPEILSEKIAVLIEERQLRKEFGKRAKGIAKDNLDLGICVNFYISFYDIIYSKINN